MSTVYVVDPITKERVVVARASAHAAYRIQDHMQRVCYELNRLEGGACYAVVDHRG